MGTTNETLTIQAPSARPFEEQVGGRRYSKPVLPVGRITLPTGETLDVTEAFAAALARDTNAWLALGQKVCAPRTHTDAPEANVGYWSRFRLERLGDREWIVADLDLQDVELAAKIGTTIRDVSVAIRRDVVAASGARFDAVIEHVALVSDPVVAAQPNFVALARALGLVATEAPVGTSRGVDMDPNKDPAMPTAPAAPEVTSARTVGVVELSREQLATELAARDARIVTLEAAVRALEGAEAVRRKRVVQEYLLGLQRAAIDLQRPIGKDDLELVAGAFDRGDEKTAQALGRAFLARARAEARGAPETISLGSTSRQGSELQDMVLAADGFARDANGKLTKCR